LNEGFKVKFSIKNPFSRIFLKAKIGEILNTKVAPKIMLINSRLSKIVAKQVLQLLARKCNN
jgi:hypothetical protein